MTRHRELMPHPKKLLVEGDTDKRVILYLMEANGVEWKDENLPVLITSIGSIDEIIKKPVIGTEIKPEGLEVLGVLIDANGDASKQWKRVRNRCREEFERVRKEIGDSSGEEIDLPEEIPKDGLDVCIHIGGPIGVFRFGVWIMPDNRFEGMLESFLVRLIPDDARGLYELARNCVEEAKRNGAPFKGVHKTKAEIHTWLAWQDEPGKQLHEAVAHQVLDPTLPHSQPFVDWFRRLFKV